MQFVSIPLIVLCSYIVGDIYKMMFKKNTKKYKLIPCLVAIFGGGLGVIIYYTAPSILNVSNFYEALGIGIVSGFTSTGTNQLIKQLKNP